jgi:hypothetical protein
VIYTISVSTGEVVRVSDGVVVAPCQSADDPDFKAYIEWVMVEGNQPTEVA